LRKLDNRIWKRKRGRMRPLKRNTRKGFRKKTIKKLERRKSNLVDELHWKIIQDMLRRNNVIFYGDIKSHNIVKNGINKILNQDMNNLKFYLFKTRLLYKAELQNRYVFVVPEPYTSQGCSTCGTLKKVYKSSIYDCKICKHKYGRDHNAAKNILMKGIIRNNLMNKN
jgi:putative transposase